MDNELNFPTNITDNLWQINYLRHEVLIKEKSGLNQKQMKAALCVMTKNKYCMFIVNARAKSCAFVVNNIGRKYISPR